MSPPTENFIFLSYARVDKSTATLVAETLDAAGLPDATRLIMLE